MQEPNYQENSEELQQQQKMIIQDHSNQQFQQISTNLIKESPESKIKGTDSLDDSKMEAEREMQRQQMIKSQQSGERQQQSLTTSASKKLHNKAESQIVISSKVCLTSQTPQGEGSNKKKVMMNESFYNDNASSSNENSSSMMILRTSRQSARNANQAHPQDAVSEISSKDSTRTGGGGVSELPPYHQIVSKNVKKIGEDKKKAVNKAEGESSSIIRKSIQGSKIRAPSETAGKVNNPSINFQTAKFGQVTDKHQLEKPLDSTKNEALNPMAMYTSMSDIGFTNKNLIISKEMREKMIIDSQNNWKVRTETIDHIAIVLQEKINSEPAIVVSQSEQLMEFLVQLLVDQNFKIVVTTLSIINSLLFLTQQQITSEAYIKGVQENHGILTSNCLGRYVPQLIKKLGDSKNIIRQEAIRALIGIFEVMRNGEKNKNNFIALIIPYLNNSSNWHIREELLNVLIISLLKSQNIYDFDPYQLCSSIVKLLNDQKERIQLIAMEAVAALASISDKVFLKDLVAKIVTAEKLSPYIIDRIMSRLDYDMAPILNHSGGVLEFPYLDQLEQMTPGGFNNPSAIISNHNLSSAGTPGMGMMVLRQQIPSGHSLSRRDSMSNSGALPIGSQLQISDNGGSGPSLIIQPPQILSRGNSQGRRLIAPPSANGMGSVGISDSLARTVSSSKKGGGPYNQESNQRLLQFNNSNFPNTDFTIDQSPFSQQSINGGYGYSFNQMHSPILYRNIDFDLSDDGIPGIPGAMAAIGSSYKHLQSQQTNTRFLPSLTKANSVQQPQLPQQAYSHKISVNGYNTNQAGYLQGQLRIGSKQHSEGTAATQEQSGMMHMNGNQNENMVGSSQMKRGASDVRTISKYPSSTSNKQILQSRGGLQVINPAVMSTPQVHANYGGGSIHKNVHSANLYSQNNAKPPHGFMNHDLIRQQLLSQQFEHNSNHFNSGQLGGALLNTSYKPALVAVDAQSSSQERQPALHPYMHQFTLSRGSDYPPKMSLDDGEDDGNTSEKYGGPRSNNFYPGNPSMMMGSGDQSSTVSTRMNINHNQIMGINGNSQSHKQSRIGMREEYTPQRPATFYSDGSFTTATTTAAQEKTGLGRGLMIPTTGKRLQIQEDASMFQRQPSSLNNESFIDASILDSQIDSGPKEHTSNPHLGTFGVGVPPPIFKSANNASVTGGGGSRKPVKAIRNANQGQNPYSNENQSSMQDLVIDSRKIMKQQKTNPSNEEENSNYGSMLKQHSLTESTGPTLNTKSQLFSGRINQKGTFGIPSTDENQSEFASSTGMEDAPRYIATEDLEPLENTDKEFRKAIKQLSSAEESGSWSSQFEACNTIRRICKHHSSLLLQQGVAQLSNIVSFLLKLAESLRSSLSKIALMTINDMLVYLRRCMEPYLENLIKVLLKKASLDTNSFIGDEADRALIALCTYCQDARVLRALLTTAIGGNLKSNLLRQRVCKCLETLIKVCGNNFLFLKENDKLLTLMASYLGDACPEVRNTAKSAFIELTQAILGKNDLEKLLQRVLNEVQYKKVRDFLDSHQQDNNGINAGASGSSQADFLITNAHTFQNQQQTRIQKVPSAGKGVNKATSQVRSSGLGSASASNRHGGAGGVGSSSSNAATQQQNNQQDTPLNIQATKILKPSQIIKKASVQNITTTIQSKAQNNINNHVE